MVYCAPQTAVADSGHPLIEERFPGPQEMIELWLYRVAGRDVRVPWAPADPKVDTAHR